MSSEAARRMPRIARAFLIALIVLSCALCSGTHLKLFELQYLELIYFAAVPVVLLWFALSPTPVHIYRPIFNIGRRWSIFCVLALLLSAYDLRQDHFFEGLSVLRWPFVVTISRVVELVLDVFFMILLACVYREDEKLRRLAGMAYYLTGIASCCWAVFCFLVAALAHVELNGVAHISHRLSGFSDEGGSFGTYLLTVVFVTWTLRHLGWLSRRAFIASMIFFCIVLIGTESKAALFELAVFILITPILRMRGSRLVLTTTLSVTVLVVGYYALDVPALLVPYTQTLNRYQAVANSRPDDLNFVAGRVSGMFLAPQMIAAHPLTGIGMGNYPVTRDDPQYRRGTPIVRLTLDSPSLGPIDYIVDLGIPLFLYFTWVEIAPAVQLIRKKASFPVLALVLMQPVSNWFGAHLNLIYPWVAAGIALGLTYAKRPEPSPEQPGVPHDAPTGEPLLPELHGSVA